MSTVVKDIIDAGDGIIQVVAVVDDRFQYVVTLSNRGNPGRQWEMSHIPALTSYLNGEDIDNEVDPTPYDEDVIWKEVLGYEPQS